MDENNNYQQNPDPINNNYNPNPNPDPINNNYNPNQGPMNNNYNPNPNGSDKDKVVAGILGILLGSIGIHKFYLGYQKEGLIMLLVTLLTCGIGGSVMGIIGLVEGILYLTKSDEEFRNTYVYNQKTWF